MAVIQSGSSTDLATVDSNKNIQTTEGLPAHAAAGGFYSVAGGTAAVIAAALAANTPLATMRFAAASTRKAYVQKIRVLVGVATVGASGGVAGTLGLQRFTAATPTGGSARTPAEMNEPLATATDMTDVRDSNAALTVTSVVFGAVVSQSLVPLFTTGGFMEWIIEPPYPIVLLPGDGLALRTVVAMAATQTWEYTWTAYWYEK